MKMESTYAQILLGETKSNTNKKMFEEVNRLAREEGSKTETSASIVLYYYVAWRADNALLTHGDF